MDIEFIYLSKDLLEELRVALFSIDVELYEALDDFLNNHWNSDKAGEYFSNIFHKDELLRLERLDKNYQLFESIDGIFNSWNGQGY